MNIFIYFSTYIIFFGFLYYFKLIKYNPFLWLLFAICVSIYIIIYITIYIINHNININYQQLIKYIIFNSPKLLLIFIIDNKNIFEGFIFYSAIFIIYLIIIDYNLYHIYYNKVIHKIINNQF
jgi:hypothetical protein